MNVLDILDDIKSFFKPVTDFFVENYDNPIFWLVIVGFIVGIFLVTYTAKPNKK